MKKYRSYIVTFVIGAVIALAVCLFKEIFTVDSTIDIVSILSDAFFTSGVLIGSIGILVMISNEGNFDTLSYGLKIIRNMWKRSEGHKKIEKNLYEYRMAKHTERKSARHLLVVGAIYLLLAALLTMVFFLLY